MDPSYNPSAKATSAAAAAAPDPNAGSYGMGLGNVPGVGNEQIYTGSGGQQYYTKDGSRYNLTPSQVQTMGLRTLASPNFGGPWQWNPPSVPPAPTQTQPAYNPNAPLPEQVALKQMAKIDPTGEAMRTTLGTGYNADLNSATAGQLPPGVMREIQQDVRGNQTARGNDAGVTQAVQEGETTGTAGLQYLNNVRSAALGYLGGGQSKLGASSQYVDRALNQQSAAMTGQMTPQYNPNTGVPSAYQFIDPNAGGQFAQGTSNFLNAGTGAKPGSPDTSGQIIGAGIGAAGSAVGALATSGALAAAFCQVGREIYGIADPRFVVFRDWILFRAPAWLRVLYARHAHTVARWLRGKPISKAVLRIFMNQMVRV
jgi:hypothetical protein